MMNPRIYLAQVALGIGAVGAAVALQLQLTIYPCSLCILQRYVFLGIALVALVAYKRPQARILPVWGGLLALTGGGLALRNLWVMSHPSIECGRDALQVFLNELPTAQMLPSMFEVTGMCSDALPNLVGLPIPGWALLGFVFAGAGFALTLRSARTAS